MVRERKGGENTSTPDSALDRLSLEQISSDGAISGSSDSRLVDD
jgi:hypothetical protein